MRPASRGAAGDAMTWMEKESLWDLSAPTARAGPPKSRMPGPLNSAVIVSS